MKGVIVDKEPSPQSRCSTGRRAPLSACEHYIVGMFLKNNVGLQVQLLNDIIIIKYVKTQ